MFLPHFMHTHLRLKKKKKKKPAARPCEFSRSRLSLPRVITSCHLSLQGRSTEKVPSGLTAEGFIRCGAALLSHRQLHPED